MAFETKISRLEMTAFDRFYARENVRFCQVLGLKKD